jgi:hypothetical protein
MKMLVGCEESDTVRAAFERIGWDAWSCDLQPSRNPKAQHYQGNVFDVIKRGWDLIILHPPCTYTSLSGNRWYWNSPLRQEGAALCSKMWKEAKENCDKVALEQPKTVMQRYIGPRSQIIQPYQFGHGETKETWLWLHGLPCLVPTDEVEGREQRIWRMPPGPDRQRERSKTFDGIALAMAIQWGAL